MGPGWGAKCGNWQGATDTDEEEDGPEQAGVDQKPPEGQVEEEVQEQDQDSGGGKLQQWLEAQAGVVPNLQAASPIARNGLTMTANNQLISGRWARPAKRMLRRVATTTRPPRIGTRSSTRRARVRRTAC